MDNNKIAPSTVLQFNKSLVIDFGMRFSDLPWEAIYALTFLPPAVVLNT